MMLLLLVQNSIVLASPASTLPPDCLSRTICNDGINTCGQRWGTCVPDCSSVAYTAPPYTTPIPSPTSDTTTSTCSPVSLCEDFVDPCGQFYGGCYDICKGEPRWTRPSCSIDPTMSLGNEDRIGSENGSKDRSGDGSENEDSLGEQDAGVEVVRMGMR